DSSSVSIAYTATGQRVSVLDSRGLTAFVYNERDRLLQRTDPDGATISYTYDEAGNRTSVTVPSGTNTYAFDALNRLSTVTDPDGGVTSYTYDAVGNRASITYPNGTKATYTYDALNRLALIENQRSDNSIISSYSYTLGPAGNRTRVQEHTGRIVDYIYDALYRLTQENITDLTLGDRIITYSYNPVGNRLSKGDTVAGPIAYTYDENDRLLTENGNTYSYDNNGNTTSKTEGSDVTTYRYDYENRLIGAQTPASLVNYTYDADGIRVSASVDGVVLNYLVDKNIAYAQVLEEKDGASALVANYVYGDDLIRMDRNGVDSFYHYDGHGNTRQLTDDGENTTDTYIYDAFGTLLNKTGATENNYLYTGEQNDMNIGFYYLRARYYNTETGRFITTDPFWGNTFDPLSLHKYIYAHENPVNNIDPSGTTILYIDLLASTYLRTLLSKIVLYRIKFITSLANIMENRIAILERPFYLFSIEYPDLMAYLLPEFVIHENLAIWYLGKRCVYGFFGIGTWFWDDIDGEVRPVTENFGQLKEFKFISSEETKDLMEEIKGEIAHGPYIGVYNPFNYTCRSWAREKYDSVD
ncbi:MAG: RHS repeat domain-containing protein, partial [bacterium]